MYYKYETESPQKTLYLFDDGGGAHGPYLEKAADIVDPWGVPYEIIVPGDVNASFDVISWGEDKQPGGEGAASDITQ